MRRTIGLLAAGLFSAFLAAPTLANDSTAELSTGGLVITKTDAIEMRSEDLFISTEEIRVRYRFLNISNADVTTLVAFPMPDIVIDGPDANVSIPTEEPENLLGMTTLVDGKQVPMRVEQKVFAKDVDQTALLKRLGIPLAPHLPATNDALDKLPRPQWDELIALGLAEIETFSLGGPMEDHLRARWTLRTTYYWDQTFPTGREITVEHTYKPSVGASVQTSIGDPEWMKEDEAKTYQSKYCMDRGFLAAVDRARRRVKNEHTPLSEERIAYILSTGANWAAPIRDFRLVVDKGNAKNFVSFCADGVKKISDTRFEVRKQNYRPSADLFVLILKPLAENP